ncbi:MAG TPA: phosphoribosylamine--glycine ligase [Longimicrobiaceae bacterium]|nr:phosphoribosylamine--glycine ligase [Longimicrobiaceae bacterium]
MKILIVGNGGREHALLWKLRQDAPEAEFFITRGNGGTEGLATSLPLSPDEIQPLAGWAEKEGVALTVVGPEGPLALGIVDHFAARGLPVFGPTKAAAEIESSKAFAKALLAKYGIPTAAFRTFTAFEEAESFIREQGAPLVVKVSGLAAGKGAVVCESIEEALDAARQMLAEHTFGVAGLEIVVEEFMRGEELSVFALADGSGVISMLPAQDHKRIGEGETGPNTGGMGAYAPVSIATKALLDRITREILQPAVAALAEEDRPFRGLLYAGLMLTEQGPKVVEFNCRFGDPETQVVLPLLASSLLEPMLAIARGESLAGMELRWRAGAAVTTVLASGGYPGDYATGLPIDIDPKVGTADDLLLFHAGTALQDGRLVTSGGRVLAVTALGPRVTQAVERSRWGAEQIRFEGRHFRRDIGWREIERSRSAGA